MGFAVMIHLSFTYSKVFTQLEHKMFPNWASIMRDKVLVKVYYTILQSWTKIIGDFFMFQQSFPSPEMKGN